jgi:hypothetical protein
MPLRRSTRFSSKVCTVSTVPDEIAGGHLVAPSHPDEVARRLYEYASGL